MATTPGPVVVARKKRERLVVGSGLKGKNIEGCGRGRLRWSSGERWSSDEGGAQVQMEP